MSRITRGVYDNMHIRGIRYYEISAPLQEAPRARERFRADRARNCAEFVPLNELTHAKCIFIAY